MPDPAKDSTTINDGQTLAIEPAAPSPAQSPPATVSPAPPAASAVAAAPASGPIPAEAGAVTTPEPPKRPADTPSLLEEVSLEGKPPATAEAMPAAEGDKKPEAEAKPADAAKASEPPKPAVEPTDYFKDVTVPETIKIEDAQRGELNGAFDALRAGDTKGGVQKLLDLHNQTVGKIVEDLTRKQYETFNDTRAQWRAKIAADEEMGGAGFETTKKAVARMRDLFVPEGDRKEFDEFLRVTGAGDNPAFFRMLHRAARYFDEPRMPPPNPRPPAGNGKPPGRGGRAADLYPNTNFSK